MKYVNETKLKKDPRVRRYETTSGDKRYRVTFKKTINHQKLRFEKQGFTKSHDAIRWADDQLKSALVRKGKSTDLNLKQYFDFWHEKNIKNGYWSEDTKVDYERLYDKWLLPKFGNYQLNEITRDEFQNWIDELQKLDRGNGKIGLATNTLRTIRRSLAALLNDAVYSDQLDANRIKNIHIKDGIGERNLKISPEKYKQALQTAHKILDPIQYAGFMLTTIGLRHGEVLGLQPKRIFQDHIEVRVARTSACPQGTTPKTKSSIRDVPITQAMYNILNMAIHELKQRCLENDLLYYDSMFLIVNKDAKPVNFNVLNHYFKRIGNQIEFHIFPHMMRHAFATFAMPLSGSSQDVANIMGHSDVSMTEYYDTGTDSGAKKVVNLVESKYN
ncbi:site-specific integrase [Paucilactobacillus sp. N302-9]